MLWIKERSLKVSIFHVKLMWWIHWLWSDFRCVQLASGLWHVSTTTTTTWQHFIYTKLTHIWIKLLSAQILIQADDVHQKGVKKVVYLTLRGECLKYYCVRSVKHMYICQGHNFKCTTISKWFGKLKVSVMPFVDSGCWLWFLLLTDPDRIPVVASDTDSNPRKII